MANIYKVLENTVSKLVLNRKNWLRKKLSLIVFDHPFYQMNSTRVEFVGHEGSVTLQFPCHRQMRKPVNY